MSSGLPLPAPPVRPTGPGSGEPEQQHHPALPPSHRLAARATSTAPPGLVALVLILLRTAGRKVPQYIAYGTFLCLGTLLFLATGRF